MSRHHVMYATQEGMTDGRSTLCGNAPTSTSPQIFYALSLCESPTSLRVSGVGSAAVTDK